MITTAFLKNSRFALLALLALLVAVAIYWFHSVAMPFAVGAFLAYLLAPLIAALVAVRIRGRLVRRGVAILLVYTLGIGLITLIGVYLVPKLTSEVNGLVRDLPRILQEIEREWVVPTERRVNGWLREFVPITTAENGGDGQPTAGLRQPESGDERSAPLAPQDRPNGGLEPLLENYTFLVREVEGGGYEIEPIKKGKKTQEPGPAKWEFSRQISETFGQFRDQLQENIVELLRLSRTYLVAVVSSFFTTFLVLMISAFILIDPARLPNFVRSLVPERFHPNYQDLLVRLDRGLSGVVRGQVTICLLNGALTGVGIAIIGVPFVITLSLIATLFSLIPIFGVLISTIPIILIALTVSFSTAVLAVGWILIIHFFEGNFLNPKILGDAARIHPVLIVFALVVGQYIGGIMGALLAVPVFSLIQSSFLFLKGLAERAEAAS